MKGYVFINEDGEFAREGEAAGFATGKQVYWVKDIHAATVFNVRNPWNGMHNKHLTYLQRCQSIEGSSKTIVTLEKWSNDHGS